MFFLQRKVAVPLWFLLTGAVTLIAALINRLLVPSVRWFFRAKANEAIHQVSNNFNIQLPEFKLTRRKELLGRVIYDTKVIEAVDKYCEEEGVPRDVAMEQVEKYANEIVPSFNAYIYFRLGAWLSKNLAQAMYRVRLGYSDEGALRNLNPNDSLVFVMNHRSNMDYVLLAHIAADRAALSYAVGEWARVFPVQQLIKALGGFFVRRNSGNQLYRRVLERYVQMATEGGVVQAMFPEGRLTGDGLLQAPRLGLLDYMLRTFDPDNERDLVLVPVAVNYDRVLEDRNMLRRFDKDAPKLSKKDQLFSSINFVIHNLKLRLKGGWYRFGYAVVNFGAPISTREYAQQQGVNFSELPKAARIEHAKVLAQILMDAVGDVVPVVPVAVVATVFTRDVDGVISAETLQTRCQAILDELHSKSAHIYVPRDNQAYAIEVGLRMLTLRDIVLEDGGGYCANRNDLTLLNYYANSIIHLFE